MKKLMLNSTLNHKSDGYAPHEIVVEKVVTLYGKEFSALRDHPMRDNLFIKENVDLMRFEDDAAHCVLFLDGNGNDGMLVDAEGCGYARKSQYIPNARAILQQDETTDAEKRIHARIMDMASEIAERAHCGDKRFLFDDFCGGCEMQEFRKELLDAVRQQLDLREDMIKTELSNPDIPLQLELSVETVPLKSLRFICPLEIKAEPQIYESDWDEPYDDGYEEISSASAADCEDEINIAIQNYADESEAKRGLMAYYSDNPAVNERFYSAFPKVEVIGSELMGIFDCQTCGESTESEIEEMRDYLSGQASDGWGEGFEQHEIKTDSLGKIFVSFWSSGDEWSMQTEEEFLSGQEETEDMGMTM